MSDSHPIDTCQLWSNFTGTWNINQTLNSVVNDVNNSFNAVNLSDGNYKWAVWCNTSTNTFSITDNSTFIIDTLKPTLNIIYPLNTTYNINISACENKLIAIFFLSNILH